jgi:methionine-rich copper-binding protein CopC
MTSTFRNITAALALLCLATGLPGQAFAHAHLKASTPADKATVKHGPQVLRLEFTEGVEPKFCTVAVTMDDGMDMGPATLATDPKDPKILLATLPGKLDAGTYKVVWHAVATDTHKTDGTYSFTVKP